jgi:hypothetical protein
MNLESVMVIADESRREPVPRVAQPANVYIVEPRYADPVSLVPLQEGARHQGRDRQAQGDVRMTRRSEKVRRRPPDAGAGRPDRLEKATHRGRQDQRGDLQGPAGRDQARDQGRRRTDVQREVKGVSVANIKGKAKRFGRSVGRRDNVRKAYVTLQPGQELNFSGEAA